MKGLGQETETVVQYDVDAVEDSYQVKVEIVRADSLAADLGTWVTNTGTLTISDQIPDTFSGFESTFSDSIGGMFEGAITDPSLSNKLELNLGSDSTDYIPSRLYDQFSMIAKAEAELTVTVWWDAGGRTRYLELDNPIGTTWGEIGPFDLTDDSSGWADEDVEELWLEFDNSSRTTPVDVRIGWIKLTE